MNEKFKCESCGKKIIDEELIQHGKSKRYWSRNYEGSKIRKVASYHKKCFAETRLNEGEKK